ncbi:unnamed protein product [Ectocarpus fasciculatus]
MIEAIPAAGRSLVFMLMCLGISESVLERQGVDSRRDMAAFSKEWVEEFGKGELGCAGPAIDAYEWRNAGYGSNINFLAIVWANALMAGRQDLSVVVRTDEWFPRTICNVTSNGEETRGWPCFFAEVPHLCAFDADQDWIQYNLLQNVSASDIRDASSRKGLKYVRRHLSSTRASFQSMRIDPMRVLAMLVDHLHSYLQPWFKADIQRILDEPDIAEMRNGKYVGMHIRRTDKANEVKLTKTEVYFRKVAQYLRSSPGGLTAADITGLWLSTDEVSVYNEVKRLVPRYFPNVKPSAVIFVSGRVTVRAMPPGLANQDGQRDRNTYEAMVLLKAELDMLAGATVFAGTYSSNMGRLLALMRRSLNKPDKSSLSTDRPSWFLGR